MFLMQICVYASDVLNISCATVPSYVYSYVHVNRFIWEQKAPGGISNVY